MKAKKNKLVTLDPFKDRHYGKRGTAKREELEAGYENFKIGALLQDTRLQRTQPRKTGGEVRHNKIIYFKD